jgi:NAD(P)-dependent dehydrogenase (short-subunit alcohol dehydrogenase family)
LQDEGRDVVPEPLDVSVPASVEAAQNEINERFGRLDALVNNAGTDYDTDQEALTADLDRVRNTFETNTLGPWRVAQAFPPLVRESPSARFVNVSSGAGALDSLTGRLFRDGERIDW